MFILIQIYTLSHTQNIVKKKKTQIIRRSKLLKQWRLHKLREDIFLFREREKEYNKQANMFTHCIIYVQE